MPKKLDLLDYNVFAFLAGDVLTKTFKISVFVHSTWHLFYKAQGDDELRNLSPSRIYRLDPGTYQFFYPNLASTAITINKVSIESKNAIYPKVFQGTAAYSTWVGTLSPTVYLEVMMTPVQVRLGVAWELRNTYSTQVGISSNLLISMLSPFVQLVDLTLTGPITAPTTLVANIDGFPQELASGKLLYTYGGAWSGETFKLFTSWFMISGSSPTDGTSDITTSLEGAGAGTFWRTIDGKKMIHGVTVNHNGLATTTNGTHFGNIRMEFATKVVCCPGDDASSVVQGC